MQYMVENNFVQVIGMIWQPMAGQCAMKYPLTAHDIENMGGFTRDNVTDWLTSHAGDFQSVDDFRATVDDEWIEWEHEESELTFNGCMFPSEDD